MKKLLLLLLSVTTFAQVGINTTNPQEQLHVSGSPTATIRVDGLSTTNPLNNGVSTNVSVDANGTLILDNKTQSNTFIVDNTDILPNVIGVETFTGALTNQQIHTSTFTLTKPSLVYIRNTVSANFFRRSNGQTISDGSLRLIGSEMRLNGLVKDRDRESYTNADNNAITGFLYLKNDTYIYLPSGTHTITINVFVLGSNRTYVEFGGNNDFLQVVVL